jgi:hypothetical protein
MNCNKIAVIGFGLMAVTFSVLALSENPAKANPAPGLWSNPDMPVGWEKLGVDDGVNVYRKEVEGNPVVAVRGEGVVDAPIARVASVIFDDKRATEWVDSLVEAKLVKMYGEHEFLEYNHIGTPFVLKDRDFLTRGTVEADLKEKTILVTMKSVDDPAMPPSKYVRGEMNGFWKLRSLENGLKTYVIAEMHADPKGSVPKWIVNLFQKGWPHNTIVSLRKQATRPDVKIIPEVLKVFPVEPSVH